MRLSSQITRSVVVGLLFFAGTAGTQVRAETRGFARERTPTLQARMEHQRERLRQVRYASRPDYGFLDPHFKTALLGLARGQHWVDVGPGSDAIMALRYLAVKQPQKAHVTVVGLEQPISESSDIGQKLAHANDVRYRHLWGRFLEDYKSGEIDPAHLVTDQFGAFTYTEKPHSILATEGRLLLPGGLLMTHVSPQTKIRDERGRDVASTWARAIQGLSLVRGLDSHLLPDNVALTFERTNAEIYVPPLTPVDFWPGSPPERSFVWRTN